MASTHATKRTVFVILFMSLASVLVFVAGFLGMSNSLTLSEQEKRKTTTSSGHPSASSSSGGTTSAPTGAPTGSKLLISDKRWEWEHTGGRATIILYEFDDSYVLFIHDECSGVPNTTIPYESLGANEYLVQFDGPELHASIPDHTGNCTFQSKWSVSTAGPYKLVVTKLRSQYVSIRESEKVFPEMHHDRLVNATINLTKPQSPCSKNGVWTALKDSAFTGQVRQVEKRPPHVKTNIKLMDMEGNGAGEEITNYAFKTCEHVEYLDRDWKNISILFVGDSHSRTAHEDVVPHLHLGPRNEHVKLLFPEVCTNFENGRRWCSVTDLFGSCTTYDQRISGSTKWDIVLINFGQHHMSGSRHGTGFFTEYAKAVDNAVRCIKKYNNTKIIWMSSPPMNRDDSYVRKFKDWRTLHRIKAFNDYADHTLAKAGFPVIDRFGALLPLIDKEPDNAHFSLMGSHQFLEQALVKHAFPE